MFSVYEVGDFVEVSGLSNFSTSHTFECGQCFRWNKDEDGAYVGVAFGHAAKIFKRRACLYISGTMDEFEKIWRPYLDLDRDYDALRHRFAVDDFTRAATAFGSGIRMLKQDPWETLCSFILSQCCNIPRIKKMVEALCENFGDPLDFEGKKLFTFPSAEKIAELSLSNLDVLRSGYRAPYVLSAARAVADGEIVFEELYSMPTCDARKKVLSLNGIGPKVADCFLLFGLQKFDAFPVDTWIKKAQILYPGKLDPSRFGPYAGIAQQYLFFYARESGLKV